MIDGLVPMHPLWAQLGVTLAHFLWQGALVAMALWGALWLMRHRPANARYVACGVAMALMAACPVATLQYVRAHPLPMLLGTDGVSLPSGFLDGAPGAIQRFPTEKERSVRSPAQPDSPVAPDARPVAGGPLDSMRPAGRSEGTRQRPDTSVLIGAGGSIGEGAPPSGDARQRWLVVGLSVGALAWLLGVSALSLRLFVGWVGLRRLRRRQTEPLPSVVGSVVERLRRVLCLSARVGVLGTRAIAEPVAFGLIRPVVLLPVSLLTQCPPDLLEAMIAHELAHIRRHDLWINLFQRVVEILLFYHPAVRWASNRMRAERELCCDDLAVAATGRRIEYAEALVRLSQTNIAEAVPLLGTGLFGRKLTIASRVRRVLQMPPSPQQGRLWLAGPVSLLLAGSLILVAHIHTADAKPSADAAKADVPQGPEVDLLARYPTELRGQPTTGGRLKGYSWEITDDDVYALTRFSYAFGDSLKIETGPADLGVWRSPVGAVCAVVIPRSKGVFRSEASPEPETIDHVWLRFHPSETAKLFPKATVRADGDKRLLPRMQRIAAVKKPNSYHQTYYGQSRVIIPPPGSGTVDVDTTDRVRRFFAIDGEKQQARYFPGLEKRLVPGRHPVSKTAAAKSFDHLWETFDRKYAMFGLRPDVDWNQLREQYRPRALAAKNTDEFADVCAEMLHHLRDPHATIQIGGHGIPVYGPSGPVNANPAACEVIVGPIERAGRWIRWGKTKDRIGFIAVDAWGDDQFVDGFDDVLEQMRNTRGLIIDVRLNRGGDEALAQKAAGRFADKEVVYAYHQTRSGPKHSDLSPRSPRKVGPRGPWRYDRPVLLLIGPRSMSSNESFVAMMRLFPQVTTMGERTAGSSGNPTHIVLTAGIKVGVSRWLDLLPDGKPIEGRGIQPGVRFEAKPDAFTGKRDDLLAAAVARLGKAPLPAKPIAAPTIRSVRDKPADDEVKRPQVIAVSPANGAESVEPVTEIRIQFDQPMDPFKMGLQWDRRRGSFHERGVPRYVADRREFVIPVRLAPGRRHHVFVNRRISKTRPPEGFQSVEGVDAETFDWWFTTQDEPAAPDAPKPRVVSVSPASGAKVPMVNLVRVRFDQPMDPQRFGWRLPDADSVHKYPPGTHMELVRHVTYDAEKHEFAMPFTLPPDWTAEMELIGFRSKQGKPADPIPLTYSTGTETFGKALLDRFAQAGKSPELRSIVEKTRQARRNLKSLSERVHHLWYATGGESNAGSVRLRSHWARFKMQGDRQFYGDASHLMLGTIIVGSDGEACWRYTGWSRRGRERKRNPEIEWALTTCPFEQMHEKNVRICDPFDSKTPDVDAVIRDMKLEYAGTASLDGRKCHLVQSWGTTPWARGNIFLSVSEWWIDAQSYRPMQLVRHFCGRHVNRFIYDRVDEAMAASEFRPPAGPKPVQRALSPLGDGYTTRYVSTGDGSRGSMSVSWGKKGPGGKRSGGGYN